MAIASVHPPFPLLFDYLLASSWTWLAVFLATIATTLRALRLYFPRRRLLVNLESSSHSPSPPPSEAEVSLFSSCTTENPSGTSISLPRSFRRRARSKSTSALEKLHRNGEGFLRSSMELLSSVLDAEFSPRLEKIASASKLFNGISAFEKTQQTGLSAFAKHAMVETGRADLHDSTNLGFKSGEVLGSGFDKGTLIRENESHCHSSVKEELLHLDEDVSSSHHWLPSWAYSLCDPLQNTFSYPSLFSDSRDSSVDDFAPLQVSPCFEHQFGWDKLLESRLGLSWSLTPTVVLGCAECRECAMESPNIVKMWTGQQKKLLKALHVDTSSTLALDVRARSGLACTGNIEGEVSLWELGHKASAKASVSFANPVSALSMNSEQGLAIVGGADGMGLWDQRSSICKPFGFTSSIPRQQKGHVSALTSRGNGLCVADDDRFLSMFDLRKLHGEPLFSGAAPHVSSNADDEEDEFDIWETLTCDFEEDACEEGCVSSNGDVVECQKGSSWLSWMASCMRVSSSVP